MKTVNPKIKIDYILEADRKIEKRRKLLEEERKKENAPPPEEDAEAKSEGEDSEGLPPQDTPEVLDPTWKPTVFKCTVLTAEEHVHIQDMRSPGELLLATLDFGLAEVHPFVDEQGQTLPLERDGDKRANFGKKPWKRAHLSRIAANDREEVAGFILAGCKLKEAEVKNS